MELKHLDPSVYTIKPLNGKDPMYMVNWWQLFNLQKSQEDTNSLDKAPDTILPITVTKKTQAHHWYGTRSKTKMNTILLDSFSEDEEGIGIGALIGSLMSHRWL